MSQGDIGERGLSQTASLNRKMTAVAAVGQKLSLIHIFNVEESPAEIVLGKEEVDTDGMNYLAGQTVDFVNKSAMNGTILAHTDGQVPNLMVNVPEQNEYYLGQLFYFFEFACGISGYLLGVNPFNQPGVCLLYTSRCV